MSHQTLAENLVPAITVHCVSTYIGFHGYDGQTQKVTLNRDSFVAVDLYQ